MDSTISIKVEMAHPVLRHIYFEVS